MKYDSIYKHQNVWGEKPNRLLAKVFERLEPGSQFLDLGCGQGRDSLFMLQNGFKVTAVDNSGEGIKKIEEARAAKHLPATRLKSFCQDMAEFKIEPDKYSTINAFNSLHFLSKAEALRVLDEIKKSLKSGGYAIICCFFTKRPLVAKKENRHCYVAAGELKKIFSEFELIKYEEKTIADRGHIGCPEPHWHYVVEMIARKK